MKARIAIVLVLLTARASAAVTAGPVLDHWRALEKGERWWNNRYQRMRMIVETSGGRKRALEIDVSDLRERSLLQKSLVVFRAPADRAGIALLGHSKPGAAADQWLYTPGSGYIRRINQNARYNRFDVTDFSYHDLDLLAMMPFWSEDDARSELRGKEIVDGVACHRIEFVPRRDYIKYKRIVLWLGQEDLVPRQLEFYQAPAQPPGMLARWFGGSESTGEEPLRRFRQWDIRSVGTIPVAHRIEAQTVQDGSRTSIEVVEVRFNQDLDVSMFHSGRLDRAGR